MLSTKHIKFRTNCPPKLLPRFVGPFTITKVINPVAFKLDLPSTMRIHNVFHASLLKPFKGRDDQDVHPLPLVVEGDEEYEVESLLARREKEVASKKTKHGKKRRIKVEYLVKWNGYGPEHNQWVSEEELTRHCKDLLKDFAKRHRS